jgi:molybdenum cofactor cytidylyltransferase
MVKSDSLAVLILAAGTSSRLGKPKQLLKLNGKSLLDITIEKALDLTSKVTVVLGDKNKEIQKEIQKYEINIVKNENYKAGIGTTISYGVSHINEKKVLIMLCDQPFIPLEHYEKLIVLSNINEDSIIASKYSHSVTYTVPAIFPKKHYEQLLKLDSDKGAKDILNSTNVFFVELERSLAIDIDTKEDINTYIKV